MESLLIPVIVVSIPPDISVYHQSLKRIHPFELKLKNIFKIHRRSSFATVYYLNSISSVSWFLCLNDCPDFTYIDFIFFIDCQSNREMMS